MLTLYHFKNSVCSERVRMALFEKGIDDWVDEHLDLFKGEQFSPEYKKLNPKAQTPTLVHNDHVIRESAIICEYIDDTFPKPDLRPTEAHRLARMREWVKTSDEHFFETVSCLSFVSVFSKVLNDKGAEAIAEHFKSQTDLARVRRQRSCLEKGFESSHVIHSIKYLMALMDDLEKCLADGRNWIIGKEFTLAEINYIPFVARIEALNMLTSFTGKHPNVIKWWERCKQRKSYMTAEVGPKSGKESKLYYDCGTRVLPNLQAIIDKINTSSIYDLAGQ